MMKPNMMRYIQNLNEIITKTEETGEAMHPYYEQVRVAIDHQELGSISKEEQTEIVHQFSKGVDQYQQLKEQVAHLKPTAKILGIHKKLERSYKNYVLACQEMLDAVNQEHINIDAFNQSEQAQDEATHDIQFCIQRIMQCV